VPATANAAISSTGDVAGFGRTGRAMSRPVSTPPRGTGDTCRADPTDDPLSAFVVASALGSVSTSVFAAAPAPAEPPASSDPDPEPDPPWLANQTSQARPSPSASNRAGSPSAESSTA
jgi:hypothetical protein